MSLNEFDSYRLHVRCTGKVHKGFRADVEMLSRWLGTVVEAAQHGHDHETVVQHGRLTCYLSLMGDRAQAKRAIAQCARGEVLTVPGCKREWIVAESRNSRNVADAAKAALHAKEPAMGFGRVTTGSRALHWKGPSTFTNRSSSKLRPAVEEPADEPPCCILCGVSAPVNIGSIYRAMGCLDFRHVLRVGRPHADVQRAVIEATSKGCTSLLTVREQTVDEFIHYLKEHGPGQRPPIVAIETASGAHDIHHFQWPQCCQIMVGAEGTGIPVAVIDCLRPGFDSLVIIPMVGPHKSLNVAMSLGMSLFSYRAQFPGIDQPMHMPSGRRNT